MQLYWTLPANTQVTVFVLIHFYWHFYLRLLKILPYIRTVDIHMKLARVSLFLVISCYRKDFFFRKTSVKEMQQKKTEEKKSK